MAVNDVRLLKKEQKRMVHRLIPQAICVTVTEQIKLLSRRGLINLVMPIIVM